MNPRAPIVRRMCELLREQDRTVAWLGESLGVFPAVLRRLIDGDHDIPAVHWRRVERWVAVHTPAMAPPAEREPPRMGPNARLVEAQERPPARRYPTRTNAALGKEVDELRARLAAVETKLVQGAQP